MKIRTSGRLLLSAVLLGDHAMVSAQTMDILGCIPRESEAVSPTDTLECQWKNGVLNATLAQLYLDGWRIAATAFYDDTKQVLYLERLTPDSP